eukprot:m.40212 g.40212  ORF g.40212 m.40212 type:complete len:1066 (+) comp5935_c0_seq1:26-3223(+)
MHTVFRRTVQLVAQPRSHLPRLVSRSSSKSAWACPSSRAVGAVVAGTRQHHQSQGSSGAWHSLWLAAGGVGAGALAIGRGRHPVAQCDNGDGGTAVGPEGVEVDRGSPVEMDPSWKETITKVSPAIVSIIVNVNRDFDQEKAGSAQATGFVVDAKRGIILTNKHVVHSGPVSARAILNNHEEVQLTPIYRDPVHDFGFFKFDPNAVQYSERVELKLRPDLAKVGTEIRVMGNNAGERFSIHAGTLARLDREAPNTGIGADFNTFYIQAASGTSGGSSGSPVLDKNGNVVALNAAGKMMTNVSLFLPLERVVHALDRIQEGRPIERGTVSAVFRHQPFGELARLGLSPTEQQTMRLVNPTATGLLTVSEVIKGGSADNVLEPGDIVLAISGVGLDSFVTLESTLDRSVGRELVFTVARGTQRLQLPVRVDDLRAVVPSSFLEVGQSIFNDLSLQTARHYNLPVGGAFVAKAGYMLSSAGIRSGCVLTQVNDVPIRGIKDLAAAFAEIPDGADVALRVFSVNNPNLAATALVRMDRRWFPMLMAVRNDTEGMWQITEAPEPANGHTHGNNDDGSDGEGGGGVTAPTAVPNGSTIMPSKDAATAAIAPSLVGIRTTVPYHHLPVGSSFIGTGLIVDAERGLVVADRLTVPTALGDIELNFGDSITVPAKVLFIHPVHNLSVCRYNPAAIGNTPVKSCRFETTRPTTGDKVRVTGITNSGRAGMAIKGYPCRIGFDQMTTSFSSATNLDAMTLSGASTAQDGVIHNDDGEVLGLYASFGTRPNRSSDRHDPGVFLGIPASAIKDMIEPIVQGKVPQYLSLGCRLEYIALSQLRKLGLPDDLARDIESCADKEYRQRQAVVVSQRWAGTDASRVLQDGDVLLKVGGHSIATVASVDAALSAASLDRVTVELFRPGHGVQHVDVSVFDGTEGHPLPMERMVLWAGSALCTPPALVRWLWDVGNSGVYVAATAMGSPARHHHLAPGSIIVEVDGQPTESIDRFLNVVNGKKDGESLRIKTVSMRGKVTMTTLTLDRTWWPTHDVRRGADGKWNRITVDRESTRVDGRPFSKL